MFDDSSSSTATIDLRRDDPPPQDITERAVRVAFARCDGCGDRVGGRLTRTGHLVGATYYSRHYRMTYRVESVGTVWQYAPDAAVRLRWANGNTTLTESARGDDRLLCDACHRGTPPLAA
jgi:hypothetical protein